MSLKEFTYNGTLVVQSSCTLKPISDLNILKSTAFTINDRPIPKVDFGVDFIEPSLAQQHGADNYTF